jgi:hypothetical protein
VFVIGADHAALADLVALLDLKAAAAADFSWRIGLLRPSHVRCR